jgi:hypothetical protein
MGSVMANVVNQISTSDRPVETTARYEYAATCGRGRFSALALLLALATLASSGCVSRRLMVNSNPPGAMVLVEGKEQGYTPTGIDFTYYGTRELTLIKDGYETKTQLVPVRAPWYQWPVIEFFSDNFLPGRVTDRQSIQFELEPKQMVPNQELLNRGQSLRSEAQIGQ